MFLMQTEQKVLVLTHNFPRSRTDISAPGFMSLYRQVNRHLPLTFVVPHDSELKSEETVEGMPVHRFRYGRDKAETLAYRGDMHRQAFMHPFKALRFFRSYRLEAERLIREISPTKIWAHWWIPGGWVGTTAARRSGLPLVVSCHGTDIALLQRIPLLRPAAARVFQAASGITVVSSYLKKRLIHLVGSKVDGLEERLIVAPLPVNSNTFYFDEKTPRVSGSIVAATRYTSQKKTDVLIHAVAKLRSEGITCQVDLYGDGPEKGNLQEVVVAQGLQDCFRLNDPITHEELADRYRSAAISLLVSEREGFGLTLVEAMLCGCAVIGARSGGITDIIQTDGEEGLLVPLNDVDALYQALKQLLTDNSLRRRLANAGRESAERRFSVDTIVRSYLDILDRTSGKGINTAS